MVLRSKFSLVILSIIFSSLEVCSKEVGNVEEHRKQIEALLKQGKTYEEIHEIMDIWWPEEYDSRYGTKTDFKKAKGKPGQKRGKSVEEQMDDIIETLSKRAAMDKQKLREHPEGPKLTPEALRVIKFVANLE